MYTMHAVELHSRHLKVLQYLSASHRLNPRAETPLLELERELALGPEEARSLVSGLAQAGLVQADLFLVNVWVQITDEGLALQQRLCPDGPETEL